MATRFLVLLVAVTFGLIVAVFVLNSLWARMFGGASIPQPANRTAQIADRQKLREENAAQRAAKLERDRYSPETLRAAARAGVPDALSTDEFNPTTGAVRWPVALQAPDYAPHREKLEALLRERARVAENREISQQAHAVAEEMFAQLKTNIRELPSDVYIAARRFLRSLSFTLRPDQNPASGENRE